MADCVRELAESGKPAPRECGACGHGFCKRDAEVHGMHYVQMQMALTHAVEIAEGKRIGGTWDDLLPYRALLNSKKS